MSPLNDLLETIIKSTIGKWARYAIIALSGLFFALAIILPPVFLYDCIPLPSSLLWLLYFTWLFILVKLLRKVMLWARKADETLETWENR